MCSNLSGKRKQFPRHAGMLSGVIGRFEKAVIDCPDPRALADFYCQVLGMRVNEDTGGWWSSAPSQASASWPSSESAHGFRRAGLILDTPSRCIWTSAWLTPIRPNRTCSRLAPLVHQADPRLASGSSSTPPAIHSASSSAGTAQAKPSSAHAAVRAVCRAEDRMRAASGTSLRGDPGAAFVLVFSPLRPEGAPGAKINPPSVPRLR